MRNDRFSSQASYVAPRPGKIGRTVAIDETGLVLGLGTRLARMTTDGRIAIESDHERVLALLAVADRRPVPPDVLGSIEAAVGDWQRGDKALAHLRLVFAGLPRVREPADAWRLRLAEIMLDEGLPPPALMKELGFDPSALDLGKVGYNPNQPRVPAGNGRESGRWEAIWNRIVSWLEEPVPEYDTDTGTQVGTRPRGRAIATNPITIIAAGAAALAGGEAIGAAALLDSEPVTGVAATENIEAFSVVGRVDELRQAIPSAQQGRITMAVGLAGA